MASITDIDYNISLLNEIASSSLCKFEGWSTCIEQAIYDLEDYKIALKLIEEQKEEIYKQNVLIGQLMLK